MINTEKNVHQGKKEEKLPKNFLPISMKTANWGKWKNCSN